MADIKEVGKNAVISRNIRLHIAIAMLAFVCAASGCAKAVVTARQSYTDNEQLRKPGRIIVHDFAATPTDLPAGDPIIGLYEKPVRYQTAEEVDMGRRLGAEIAGELVKGIIALGMSAERSNTGVTPSVGDLMIKGAFVSIDKGDRLKRILIGFGAGAGEVKTIVEVYQVTDEGARPLVSEEIKATGGKMPGMLFTVAAAVGAGPAGLAVSPTATTGTVGTAGQAAATSGGVNVAKELGPESLGAAVKKTAGEITKALSKIFSQQGWIKE